MTTKTLDTSLVCLMNSFVIKLVTWAVGQRGLI